MSESPYFYAIAPIFLVFVGFVLTWRWIADVRDLLLSVKYRVDKHHEALNIQLDYNRSVEDHLDRLDGHTGATRPTCAESGCTTTVGIEGARCHRCIRKLRGGTEGKRVHGS